ncbi:MAG: alpha/beta fold hydrolase [Burkholderiaceae bacterium]
MVAQILRALVAAGLLFATLIAAALWLLAHWPPWLAVAVGITIPLALHAALILTGVVAAVLVRRHAPLPERARLADSGGLVKAWLLECGSAWKTFLLAQPLLGDSPLASADQMTRPPILLVHGHMCNRAVWRPFARWLAARGHPVASVNLEPVFAPIERHTERVHGELRRLLRRSGASQAIVIGHSMGGLVLRAMLRDYGHDLVSTLVTIGSPHRGTILARLGAQPNVRQMRPGSEFLRELEAHESQHGLPRTLVVLSLHDNVVIPVAEQTLAGARVQVWRGHGHLQMVHRPSVWARIMAVCDRESARTGGVDPSRPTGEARRRGSDEVAGNEIRPADETSIDSRPA